MSPSLFRTFLVAFALLCVAARPIDLRAATFTVTSTTDAGAGSLRAAITAANAAAGADTIRFNIPGPGLRTITLSSALPTISGQLLLNGYSQSGASTNTIDPGSNAVLLIELNGNNSVATAINITASNCVIRGLVINRCTTNSITLQSSATNTVIAGNFLGTNAAGTASSGTGNGLLVLSASNWIGGYDVEARNLFSGNPTGPGLRFSGTACIDNQVMVNQFGLSANGTATIGGLLEGVRADAGSNDNHLGTTGYSLNRITGCTGAGVVVMGTATRLDISSNYIWSNGGLGIDLNNDGVTPNDAGDLDNGPNGLQNHPVITAAMSDMKGAIYVDFTATGRPNARYRFDLYMENGAGDPSGHGEGREWIGTRWFWMDASGTGSYSMTGGRGNYIPAGTRITLVATDEDEAASSEFAANVPCTVGVLLVTNTSETVNGNTGSVIDLVNTPGADGISLREAVLACNNNADAWTANQVFFNLPGSGPQTIQLTSPLPTIGYATSFFGNSDPDFAGTPVVRLDGSSAGAGAVGMRFNVGYCLVRSLCITGFSSHGIEFDQLMSIVDGCHIGVMPDGNTCGPNGGAGVFINNSPACSIGLEYSTYNNVISGNAIAGVLIEGGLAYANQVCRSRIGTNLAGTAAICTQPYGILMRNGTFGNMIGSTDAAKANVISGHTVDGIKGTSPANTVMHNRIGTDLAGGAALPNATSGIDLTGHSSYIVNNVVSGNGWRGMLLQGDSCRVHGNRVGTNSAGTAALPNVFGGIRCTGGAGIAIGGDAATANTISGNGQNGLELINTTGATVAYDRIGLGSDGATVIPNTAAGLFLSGASDTRVLNNTVSGNLGDGAYVLNSDRAVFHNNRIGTQAAGTSARPNGYTGITIEHSLDWVVGSDAATGNLISGNGHQGLYVISGSHGGKAAGNHIGTDITGVSALANAHQGVLIDASNNALIGLPDAGNIVSGNAQDGIVVRAGATGCRIRSNRVGVRADGDAALPNTGEGITLASGATGNTIGGSATGEGNIVAGNTGWGIHLSEADANTVAGNRIGVNASGAARANLCGVMVEASDNNIIGGTDAASRNIISGNLEYGVYTNENSAGNHIRGNHIGTDAAGTTAIGNGLSGVKIRDGLNNTVGGTTPAHGNVISGNGANGVEISRNLLPTSGNAVQNNRIGTNATGTAALGNVYGVLVQDNAAATIVRDNLISGNNSHGIVLQNVSGAQVKGNLIGTDAGGNAPLGNGQHGIWMGLSASNNLIGGTTAADRNVIGANTESGVNLQENAADNVITGNHIGVGTDGTTDIGNHDHGIHLRTTSSATRIGGVLAGAGNTISGNDKNGIEIERNCTGNVLGNLIGTSADGLNDRGNTRSGIHLSANSWTIGGTASGAGNTISGNDAHGIDIDAATGGGSGNTIAGNRIGTNSGGTGSIANTLNGVRMDGNSNVIGGTVTGASNTIAGNTQHGVQVLGPGTGNLIATNAIRSNGGLGIELNNDGQDVNDASDGDTGANTKQNFPVLANASSNATTTTVQGSINTTPGSDVRIEFFSNPTGTIDPSGYGEGHTYIGSTTVTTDAGGNAAFSALLPVPVSIGSRITSNATRVVSGVPTSTSEFSGNVLVVSQVNVSGTVFEDVNYGGGAGRDRATALANGGSGRPNARVELFNSSGNLVASTTTDASGAYVFSSTLPGNYTVRVVNGTVSSARTGYVAGSHVPVQTFRTHVVSGTAQPLTDRVGGEVPALADAGNGTTTLAALTTATTSAQSITSVNVSGNHVTGVDFGYSFSVICNTNDAGQGSLRQFITNANALSNTPLTIQGRTANIDHAVFMISNGTAAAGLRAANNYFTGGVATISPTSPLTAITSAVVIDGQTQPGWASAPIIELNGAGAGAAADGIAITGGANTIRGLVIDRFTDDGIDIRSTGNTVQGCYLGTNAAGTAAQPNGNAGIANYGDNTVIGGSTPAQRNLISGNTNVGIVCTNTISAGNNMVVKGNWIGLNASGNATVGNPQWGILVQGVGNTLIGGTGAGEGNVICGGGAPLYIDLGATTTAIYGNYIGIAPNGVSVLGAASWGIFVTSSGSPTTGTLIGNGTAAGRNVIAGIDLAGVWLNTGSSGTVMKGNYVGTDATGNTAAPSDFMGINIHGSSGNTIGGPAAGEGNVIAGNDFDGIQIHETGATNNTVQGNKIGVGADGTTALGNGDSGVVLGNSASNNLIGGTNAGEGNLIANNAAGVSMTATCGIGNRILGNSITANTALGIDLGTNGVTANDAGDADAGANNLQNFPVLGAAVSAGGNTTINGTLNSTASTTFRIEFFSSPTADPTGFGEGATYLGFTNVTTNASGNATFNPTLTGVSLANGHMVSATATNSTSNSTSEFSAAIAVSAGFTVAGTVFEDVHYGGAAGRTLTTATAAGGTGRNGARVELFDGSNNFVTSTTTAAGGTYAFNSLSPGNYTVRVVNSSVSSARTGYVAGTHLAVQTFRTNASTGTAIAVTDFVGGEVPNKQDAGNGTSTLAAITTATLAPQSITPVTITSSSVSGVDFGYSFSVVCNTNDAGQGSLRQFISNANALSNSGLAIQGRTTGMEHAIFMIGNGTAAPGLRSANNFFSSGVATIQPSIFMTHITAPLVLDAQTQPGWTNAPILELNGNGSNASGLRFTTGANGSVLRGFVIGRFTDAGVEVEGNDVTVQGCYIGTDATGTLARSNGGAGIEVLMAGNCLIGGSTSTTRNIISGNGWDGILCTGCTNSTIMGNRIGTNAAGTAVIPNASNGVSLLNANNVVIGTNGDGANDAAEGNIISGNTSKGIHVGNSPGTVIAGNLIGTDITATVDLGNTSNGIGLDNTSNCRIGTNADGISDVLERNIISGNNGVGINLASASTTGCVIAGNHIGTNGNGTAALGNTGGGLFFISNPNGNRVGTNGDGTNDALEANLISGNGGHGIYLHNNSNNNTIAGNRIGTDVTGISALPNTSGIYIQNASSPNNTIGGASAVFGNLIAGNTGAGVTAAGNGTVVSHNWVGLKSDGTALPNGGGGVSMAGSGCSATNNVVSGNTGFGIWVTGASSQVLDNLVGTDPSGTLARPNTTSGIVLQCSDGLIQGNTISGNTSHGLSISGGSGASLATITGNRIGITTGGAPLGNGGHGILINAPAAHLRIGGVAAGEANTIANNTGDGLFMPNGGSGMALIRANAIFNNGGLGIDLGPDGVTVNDPNDADSGPNNLQNFPLLGAVSSAGGTTTINGTLHSTASTPFRIEFFSSPTADPTGNGEGSTYLGSTTVTTDASGNASVNTTLSGVSLTTGHVVSSTATNTAINSTSEFSRAVTVTLPPIAICQNATLVLSASGTATLSPSLVDGGSTDPDGTIAGLSVSQTLFTCADLGANTVTLTVTDNSGATATCIATVTVVDNINPVINNCPANINLTAGAACNAVATWTTPSVSDNCGGATITRTAGPASGSIFPLGSTFITYTATDAAGNQSTCTFNVVVQDATAPVITGCPANITLNAGAACNAVATWTAPSVSDNCSGATITRTAGPASGSIFPLGSTFITYTATDAAGNQSTCTFNVVVQDATAPVITGCPANITLNAGAACNAVATWTAPSVSDNCSGATITRTAGPASGSTFPLGSTFITYTATDAAGNQSTCTFNVVVQDATAPVITGCPANITLNAGAACNAVATWTAPSVSDNCSGATITRTAGPASGSTFPLGSTTVTYTATDAAGRTATCSFMVTVNDVTGPVINCPANIVVGSTANLCGAVVNYPAPVGTDNCSGASTVRIAGPASGSTFPIGITTVTHRVTDATGLQATCSFTVTVTDNEPPNAICQSVNIGLNGSGVANLTPAQVNGGSTDNCTITGMSVAPSSFTSTGTHTVTLTVTDAAGNSDACTVNITVSDNNAPTAVCSNATIHLNAAGQSTVTGAMLNGGSTDNGTIVSLTPSQTLFDCSDLGPNNVTLTVADDGGNTDVCNAVVTVLDTIRPQAACHPLTVQLDATGHVTITASDIDNGSSDNCSVTSTTIDRNSFDCADLGANIVLLTVTDGSGNSTTCATIVTVEDPILPTIICPGNIVLDNDPGICGAVVNYTLPNVTDNCSDPVLTRTSGPASGSLFPLGTTTVEYEVSDAAGHASTCSFSVTVNDTEAPNAVCQSANIGLNDQGLAALTPQQVDGGSTDNCAIDSLVVSPSSFTAAGNYTVTLTVFDAAGNSDACTVGITVTDGHAPVALCRDTTIHVDAMGHATITAADIDEGSTDNGGIAELSASQTVFDCGDLGANAVILTVTDDNGNTDQCTAIVTVLDTIAPVVVCQAITVQLDINGDAIIAGVDIDGGSTDNCGGTLDYTAAVTEFHTAGTYDVLLTVTDPSGNSSTCTASVTVEQPDYTPPSAVCAPAVVHLDANGSAGISPSDVDGGSTDDIGITQMWVHPSLFACDDLGANEVVLVVSDAAGNLDSCIAMVMVLDTIAPEAICNELEIDLDGNGQAIITGVDIGAGSMDNCGSTTLTYSTDITAFQSTGTFDVTLTVTDASGNSSSCIASVTVTDDGGPVAVCRNDTVYLDAAGVAPITPGDIDGGSTANGLFELTASQTVFGCDQVGANNVTLTITDANGTDQCTAIVTVLDTLMPTVVCRDITIRLDDAGHATITAAELDGGSFDNCGISDAVISIAEFDSAGTYQVELTVTDAAGNSSSCMAMVTVDPPTEEEALVIPFGFSPNDDGIADTWIIRGVPPGTPVQVEILNRWGDTVHADADYHNDWDGTCTKGIGPLGALPDGTYFFIATIGDGKPVTGYLQIAR